MAIEVKDSTTGELKEAASNTKGNTALGFGILGTALGALGLAGAGAAAYGNGNGSNGSNGRVEQDSPVSIFRYFEDRERDNNRTWELAFKLETELGAIRERLAVNETANTYQNQIIAAGFANVDKRFETEKYIDELNLRIALCDVVRSEPMIPMSKLGLKVADDMYGVDTYKRFDHHHHQPHHNQRPCRTF